MVLTCREVAIRYNASVLSKSDFLLFLESPLHLWADAHNQIPLKDPSAHELHIRQQGYQLESLAKQFLEQKVLREYPPGSTIEFEVTLTDGEYVTRVDALVHDTTHNTYDIYEIKSGTSIKTEHKYDVTFQHLIARAALPQLHKLYLVHVNGEYIKDGEIDISQLFVIADMADTIDKLDESVYLLRSDARAILKADQPPLDDRCTKPKECPCPDLCFPNLPVYSIYDLPNARKKTYDELLDMGITELAKIPSTFRLSPRQKAFHQSMLQQKALINTEKISEELGALQYPLYFLDYETFGPGLPIHDGYKPYQHITFQYSLFVVENEQDDEPQHYEFLAIDGAECSGALCESMLSQIGAEGTVIVWHKPFEMGRNKELAELQPECAERLLSINSRVYDLKDIFAKSYYADYRFHGSASIKDVLPVLVPELSYDELDIKKGDIAMTKWYEMVYGDLSEAEKEKIRYDLKLYCKLDTLAMVEVWKIIDRSQEVNHLAN